MCSNILVYMCIRMYVFSLTEKKFCYVLFVCRNGFHKKHNPYTKDQGVRIKALYRGNAYLSSIRSVC